MSNIISMQDKIISNVRTDIEAALKNRGSNRVSEAFIYMVAEKRSVKTSNISTVLNNMVSEGALEKTYQKIPLPMGNSIRLPLYRLR